MSGDIGLEQPIIFYHEEITEAKKIVLEHKGIKLAYLKINNKEKVSGNQEYNNGDIAELILAHMQRKFKKRLSTAKLSREQIISIGDLPRVSSGSKRNFNNYNF